MRYMGRSSFVGTPQFSFSLCLCYCMFLHFVAVTKPGEAPTPILCMFGGPTFLTPHPCYSCSYCLQCYRIRVTRPVGGRQLLLQPFYGSGACAPATFVGPGGTSVVVFPVGQAPRQGDNQRFTAVRRVTSTIQPV